MGGMGNGGGLAGGGGYVDIACRYTESLLKEFIYFIDKTGDSANEFRAGLLIRNLCSVCGSANIVWHADSND